MTESLAHIPAVANKEDSSHQAPESVPDSKVPGANMGPIWGRQDPDGPHFGPMNFAIWGLETSNAPHRRKHMRYETVTRI